VMLVNFAWPRAQSNPTPKQEDLLLDFHWGWLNGVPILWSVFVFILVIGVLYYLIAGRRKQFAAVVVPADEPATATGASASGGG
jgi:hypothetical protein